MAWNLLQQPTKEESSSLSRQFQKKSKFLVDENLGIGVADFLQERKWNVKYVGEVGLAGHSDDDVYAYSFKHKRILLTHDTDYLDNSKFPFHRNPGVFIFPGGEGGTRVLVRALSIMLNIFAPYYNLYEGSKIIFYEDGTIKTMQIGFEGKVEIQRYKFTKHEAFLWGNY